MRAASVVLLRAALGALRALAALAAPAVVATFAAGATEALAQARSTPAASRSADDLARARVLDQQGARAYADGRYNDSIRYFEEAHRLGGPPFELWNIAKCHVRLDQPEQAAEVLERYLATPSLPAEDREEATQQLDALRRRPSTVTIASTPMGATVTVDGRAIEGKTPTSVSVQPGAHTITLGHPNHGVYKQRLEAKYGRAIILDVPLAKHDKASPAENPYGEGGIRRVSLRADVGVMLPRYGEIGGVPHAALAASSTYRVADVGAAALGVGVMLLLTGDSWDNTVGAPSTVPPCGTLSSPRSATAASLFAMGSAGWQLSTRLRLHALGGVGGAALVASDLGGDVFVPACRPSPGLRPAVVVGGQLDYALTPLVRLSALPLLLQIQPSFEGTRSAPLDASGVWMRAVVALGGGVDF